MESVEVEQYGACLNFAEKIINTLNNKDVVERYFDMKKNLAENQRRSSISASVDQHIARSKENARLRNDLIDMIISKPNYKNDPENEAISLKILELEKKIIPKQVFIPSGDTVSEIDNLKRVIDAKLNAIALARKQLRLENMRLKNDFKEISNSMNSQISLAIEKEKDELEKIQEEEYDLNSQFQAIEGQTEDARELYDSVYDEHREVVRHKENLSLELENLEKQIHLSISIFENKNEEKYKLEKDIEFMRYQLEELSRSVASQQFGNTNDKNVLDELYQLSETADLLRTQNKQLELQIKNDPHQAFALTSSSRIDEDDLATQILLSGWK